LPSLDGPRRERHCFDDAEEGICYLLAQRGPERQCGIGDLIDVEPGVEVVVSECELPTLRP
jgi:hypothetical protein